MEVTIWTSDLTYEYIKINADIEHDIKKYDKYFITKDFNDFKEIIYLKKTKVLKLGIKIIQFRSKNLSITEYSNLSKKS